MSLDGQFRPVPTAVNKPNIATMVAQGFFLMNPIPLWTFHVVREFFWKNEATALNPGAIQKSGGRPKQ
jgi:hypothetical protein